MAQEEYSGIPCEIFSSMLRESVAAAYIYKQNYANESDFKFELYHQLALNRFNNSFLHQKAMNANTCYLHSEGKPENGNPAKADLLVCNPYQFQKFNFYVDYILEIKKIMNVNNVGIEIAKLKSYRKEYTKVYFISVDNVNDVVKKSVEDLASTGRQKVVLLYPGNLRSTEAVASNRIQYNIDEVSKIVESSIEYALNLYANGMRQFHGFYWCNYEHETNKKFTYPCEGDFICQLYHDIRNKLPSINILSEFHPGQNNHRIDLVVFPNDKSWCIPIDVKMNWDQFKRKFEKSGKEKTPEAELILERFDELGTVFPKLYPIIVVIQGENAQETNKKE